MAYNSDRATSGGGDGSDDTWLEFTTRNGFVYFLNTITGATQWEVPPPGSKVLPGTRATTARHGTGLSPRSVDEDSPVLPIGTARQSQWASPSAASAAPSSSSSASVSSYPSATSLSKGVVPPPVPVRRSREEWRDAWKQIGVDVESERKPASVTFADLPSMSSETKNIIMSSKAMTKKEGYSTQKPAVDLGTFSMMKPNADHARLDGPTGGGIGGKATAVFSSMMRSTSPRAGAVKGKTVSSTTVPSQTTTGYAFKHVNQKRQDSVFSRLTDVRGFTGSHRHRFDESGRGRGLHGRDRQETSHQLSRKEREAPVPFLSPR